jgi:hypothetical protein
VSGPVNKPKIADGKDPFTLFSFPASTGRAQAGFGRAGLRRKEFRYLFSLSSAHNTDTFYSIFYPYPWGTRESFTH